ncbi:hypothetical protein POTOM_040559 [Populus tomentosa]|uniref:non-specific serine/threonine protein kinase n=1 Tax=Populus tomentosa TaxID=118781 RepID=A0A8X7Z0Z7_POPTO|nr:hypothetical protein POTOM_040559 [Populus tomentosa]
MITNMRLTANVRTGEKTLLSSWRSPSDPSIGTLSFGIDPVRIPQCFIWNHSHPIYRTGPWNGQVFIGIPGMNSVNINGFDILPDGNGTFTLLLSSANESHIVSFVLSYDGNFNELYWDYGKEEWVNVGRVPNDECGVYGKCGSFGICNAKNSPICSCMKGFEPKDADEWNSRNWTGGCVRRRPMQCERIQYGGEAGKEDGFLKLQTVKVPDFADRSLAVSEQTCRENCMNNCSCIAYAYYTGIHCMLWWESLTDTRTFPSGGADLYVRLAYSELDNRTISMKVIIGLTVVVGAIISAICVFCMWRRIADYRGEEKMLVYEYMPNKSLDAFLFDPLRKQLLDWNKRFDIVDGICRGLLYLHRDSRLKIIHRDLKASNILLDGNLNPKISDFGMARIFGGNEDQANTRRVVGTYGYMSPEYAIQGRFSEKSDVFSFGVLLLEIASGRKNTSFYDSEQVSSLIGFAWKSWNEGNIGAIVDPVISNPSFEVEVFRCIHIGLLCVQELARDRPTISTVISMLNSEIVDLPAPKQSAFAERQEVSPSSYLVLALEPSCNYILTRYTNKIAIAADGTYPPRQDVSPSSYLVLALEPSWNYILTRHGSCGTKAIFAIRPYRACPALSVNHQVIRTRFHTSPSEEYYGNEHCRSQQFSKYEPSDTYIPQMRLAANSKTGKKTLLTSWKSPSDPSIGSFSLGIDPSSIPEVVLWNDSRPIWRTGPWNGQVFIGVPEMTSVYLDGFNLADDGNGGFTLSVVFADESYITNFVLSSDGKFGQVYWDDTNKGSWSYQWESVQDECDVYGKCGSFASCNAKNSPICSCLKGFEPKNADEWNSRNWTNGCVRRKAMRCERIQNGGELGKEDGFLKLERVKVPDFAEWSSSITEQKCRYDCWNNCSCVAYAYYTGIYCMLWKGNLTDIKMFSSGGADLYIRLAYTELDNKKINLKVIISLTVVVGAIAIAICVFYSWRRTERKRTSKKGKFPDGQEIALKRLSRASGQGQEEFTTEVVVISKLQHMNLVRLLGCCVEGEEKMLVYEYMPNRSLDAFLFDPSRKHLLDWKKRFNIVEGICRGLLYLHRDSRLRIIHRDLKASNILLDQELNPKISDFGMARIFARNEDQADTGRVVGTFGYMSPEYAMEGRFSEKSDVFSFGVLLLEIISGRKNTSFYGNEEALSLLGYAWKLWNEGNIAALVDPGISYPSFREEIFRCVHVGLLCVQEFAKDRPAIFTIISMLNSEIVDLPTPKQPAFSERRSKKTLLTSWKSPSDPSIGSISGGIDPSRIPQFYVWNGSRPIWRTGPWNGQVFIGIPEMVSVYLDGFNIADEGNGTFTLSVGFANESLISNYILSSEGKFGKVLWDDTEGSWRYEWNFPKDECDIYGKCGSFGSCNPKDSPICSCLKGFEPQNADEWNNGNWTNGCVRRRELQCERTQNGGQVGKEDGFLKLERMKVPDFSEWLSSTSEQTCKNECLNINCSCIAYSYYPGFGCMLWRGNLTDLKQFPIKAADLYIRLADSELDNKKVNLKVIISLTVVGGAIAIAICVFYSWRRIDSLRKQLLDWKNRFKIVEGICRGLLYLHRDSRLRIIHRDLKASNILLDQELNPKISDFGMARIFGNHEDQANTRRVVGTYGYMSPEYAMEGRFSEKSDVFSFGVLLLEIISGRKNTSFYGNEDDLSLLGYAWRLWNDGNIAALVDPGISYPSFREEIFRCVHVGLLCVQEFAKDRPAIFTVISMLNSEIVDLPTPKQPAFSERRSERDTGSLQHDRRPESVNNVTTQITSWKSPSDPSVGSFSSGIEPTSIPEVFVWNDSRPLWRSGPWNGQAFIGIPEMNSVYLNGYNLEQDGDGTFSLSVGLVNESYITNFALSYEGRFGEIYWDSANERWEHKKQYPGDDCDIYGKCGPFGFCNTQNSPICRCLKGFEPKNSDEWNRRNWTNGCVRRRELKCERTQSDGQVPKDDEFLELDMVKVPDFSEWSSSASEQNCKDECLNNCSCIAYSHQTGIGCMLWREKLTDIRKFSSGGANLYVRLADLEFGKNRDMKAVISITVVTGAIIIAAGAFFWWRWMAKYRERKRESERILSSRRKKGYPVFFNGNLIQESMNQVKFQELPLFKLQTLIAATDYFDAANKLGEGGFGPVYRGNLSDGQEIAVKRLSRASGQGQEEFMNEVVVISELQHRNLVRLLGCCVEGDEKMLVYEYMPNKSLDASLFDPVRKEVLDWKKRFNIVDGICRGLLYLHRDSRLRIIHRDLKPSNILLDQELNPKISDFGMARIFGGNEDYVNTRRVVGTYGYMSPEYAMHGRFSEKSDVFSFGVLLLEIVSGRRISKIDGNEQGLNLLEFAWKVWNEGNAPVLVDPALTLDQYSKVEIVENRNISVYKIGIIETCVMYLVIVILCCKVSN